MCIIATAYSLGRMRGWIVRCKVTSLAHSLTMDHQAMMITV